MLLKCKSTNFFRTGKNKLSNSSTAATWIFSVFTQYKFLDDGATFGNEADEVGAGGPSADVDGEWSTGILPAFIDHTALLVENLKRGVRIH